MTSDQKPSEVEPAPFKCAVCDEPARGFHFGAFTCEGCKSFFGRTTMKKASEKFECKNNGHCDVKGSNRTSCKFCRFRTCLDVGMSPTNSRFGRRSKYFKISIASKISNEVLINPVSPLTQKHSDSRANMQIPHNISSIYPLYSIILNRFLQFYGFPQNLKREKM